MRIGPKVPKYNFNPHAQLYLGFQGWSICRREREGRRVDTENCLSCITSWCFYFFRVEEFFKLKESVDFGINLG